jgi:hypothetical protein
MRDVSRVLENLADDRLFVDGIVDCLTHSDVIERRHLGVDGDPPDVRAGLLHECEVRVFFDLSDVIGRHIDDEVDATGK